MEFDGATTMPRGALDRPLQRRPRIPSSCVYYASPREVSGESPRATSVGSYEQRHVAVTAQYLAATDNPFIAADVERRGMSFFGEGRVGPTGWAGVGGLDLFDPDVDDEGDSRRRLIVGGARWSRMGSSGRLGVVVTLEQDYASSTSQLLDRRLLAQTHVEF